MANSKRTVAPKTLEPEVEPEELIALDEDEDPGLFEVRQPLFTLRGVVYDARVNFSVNEVSEYSRISRTQGMDAGIEWLLKTALGEEGYQAYSGYKYLRQGPANKIVQQVLDRFLGDEIDPK
jgi:hypothetical protein